MPINTQPFIPQLTQFRVRNGVGGIPRSATAFDNILTADTIQEGTCDYLGRQIVIAQTSEEITYGPPVFATGNGLDTAATQQTLVRAVYIAPRCILEGIFGYIWHTNPAQPAEAGFVTLWEGDGVKAADGSGTMTGSYSSLSKSRIAIPVYGQRGTTFSLDIPFHFERGLSITYGLDPNVYNSSDGSAFSINFTARIRVSQLA